MSFFDDQQRVPNHEARAAAAVGVMLGYGVDAMVAAKQACTEGRATPAQQRMVAHILEVLVHGG